MLSRSRVAICFAFAHWALLLAIQTGDLIAYRAAGAEHGLGWRLSQLAMLPFLQAQNVLVAAAVGLIAYFASRHRITAWLWFLVYVALSASLLLDQVYYKVFLDHFHLGMIEGGEQFNAVILWDSFLDEADWVVGASAAVGIAGCVWLAIALSRPSKRPVRVRVAVTVLAAFGLAGIPKFFSTSAGHVNEHPLISLAREWQQRSVAEILARRSRSQIHLPLTSLDPSIDRDPRLPALLAAVRGRKPRPNLVLVVMESVGAVDLLGPDGLPSDKITPNLAKLARKGIVFGSIYTTFPGTTRSLISLHTGGRQPTSGYMDEVEPTFRAPLLARYFEKNGYATALYSSERLDGEATDVFLEKAGYQKFYDFSRDSAENRRKEELDSWGGREEYTLGLMEDWIRCQRADAPFFLEYITVATHHPYAVPAGYRGPAKPGDRHAEYLNALNYSDRTIGALVDFLAARKLLDHTIIAVTGDHGEAFGDLHENNLLHKNYIYDENVRDFLLLRDGRLETQTVASSRVAKNGDVMPTLLALAGLPPADVPGRDLLQENFANEPVFFHKMAPPEMLGLRDGRWKFIYDIRANRPELYDLTADPTEQKNIAAAHANLAEQYRAMCQQWYLGSEREFVSYLEDWPRKRSPGGNVMNARTFTVGYWQQRGNPSSFVEGRTIRQDQHPVVLTEWAGDFDPSAVYAWTSPSGQTFFSRPLNESDSHVTYSPFQGQDPLEPGKWDVQLRVRGKFPLTMHFSVERPRS